MESSPEVPKTITEEIQSLKMPAKERLGSGGKFMDVVADRSRELMEKYPDAKKRRAFHALIGSTIPPNVEGIIEEDFPGEDSVVEFLKTVGTPPDEDK